MAKSKVIRFRGAQIRQANLIVKDSTCIVRAHILTDITPELAEYFGWEIYHNGRLISGLKARTPLEGEVFLKEISFKPNGIGGKDPLEIVATTATDFALVRRKSETGDGIETNLRFVVDSLAWQELSQFYGMMGRVDGVLKMELNPADSGAQATLDEQPHLAAKDADADDAPEDDDKPVIGKSRTGALASRIRMEKVQ
jgi:hypothetical protein